MEKQQVKVLKIGGEILNSLSALNRVIEIVSKHKPQNLVLVHGGGTLLNHYAKKLGIEQRMVDGRRVTTKETLELCTMVYAGLLNKQLVAKFSASGLTSLGLSGADLKSVQSKKREVSPVDYGQVGDVQNVNLEVFSQLLSLGVLPIVCSLTLGEEYELLNTNADSLASEIAIKLSESYEVSLLYCFEKEGVLLNVNEEKSLIPVLSKKEYLNLKESQKVAKGMLPKLETGFKALEKGVARVQILSSTGLESALIDRKVGTQLILES